MSDLLYEQQGSLLFITFNRMEKHNAFEPNMLQTLQHMIEDANQTPSIRVIILKANGPDFSAGADIAWMQRMANFNQADNHKDAMILARLLYTLHTSAKPTIAMIQGAAYGGGAGFACCVDAVIAADTARFCFSEVKLGLIPAVISPYVVKAIGERATIEIFMTAYVFSAERAYALKLVHHCVPEDELFTFTVEYATKIAALAPEAVKAVKTLVREVANRPIDEHLLNRTATLIAEKRVSTEGQLGLNAFLHKKTPNWN